MSTIIKEISIEAGQTKPDQLPKLELLRKNKEVGMRKSSAYPDGTQPHP